MRPNPLKVNNLSKESMALSSIVPCFSGMWESRKNGSWIYKAIMHNALRILELERIIARRLHLTPYGIVIQWVTGYSYGIVSAVRHSPQGRDRNGTERSVRLLTRDSARGSTSKSWGSRPKLPTMRPHERADLKAKMSGTAGQGIK
jgi:hypothetical protein